MCMKRIDLSVTDTVYTNLQNGHCRASYDPIITVNIAFTILLVQINALLQCCSRDRFRDLILMLK